MVVNSRLKKVRNVRKKLHQSGTVRQQLASLVQKAKSKFKGLQQTPKVKSIMSVEKKHLAQKNAVEAVRALQSKAMVNKNAIQAVRKMQSKAMSGALLKGPTRPPPPPPIQAPRRPPPPPPMPVGIPRPKLPAKPFHLRAAKLK
jgi:hypothetical protein